MLPIIKGKSKGKYFQSQPIMVWQASNHVGNDYLTSEMFEFHVKTSSTSYFIEIHAIFV